MGEVRARWCFTAIDGKRRIYATAKIDTGSTTIVLPLRAARRIGVAPESLGLPHPGPVLDAQKRRIPGEWFLIGEARAVEARHNCHYAPVVLIFGQRGRREAIIGTKPLQDVGTTIRLERGGDTFHCDRKAVMRSLGAAVDLRTRARAEVADLSRALRRNDSPRPRSRTR